MRHLLITVFVLAIYLAGTDTSAAPEDAAGQTIQLERNATLSGDEAPQMAGVPLQIQAVVQNASRGGVIASQGAQQHGWSLYVRDAKPVLAVCRAGQRFELTADQVLADEEIELTGELRSDGTLRLLLNGLEIARGDAGGLIPAEPSMANRCSITARSTRDGGPMGCIRLLPTRRCGMTSR